MFPLWPSPPSTWQGGTLCAVLLAVNESILQGKVPSEERALDKVERRMSQHEQSRDTFDAATDTGVDPDRNNFVLG